MSLRKSEVYLGSSLAGRLQETPQGVEFTYDSHYLRSQKARPIAMTLPLQQEAHRSPHLFPFFFGLLSEGSLMADQCQVLKIDEADFFGRLLATCHTDTIGAVTVKEIS